MWLSFLTRLQRPPFLIAVACSLRTSSGRTSLIPHPPPPPPHPSVYSRNEHQTKLAETEKSSRASSSGNPSLLSNLPAFSLSTANEEGTGSSDGDFEETQWNGTQYRGSQGKRRFFVN